MEVWSLKLQKKFYEQTCLDKVVNHDWEGEIKSAGNKVMIRVRPTVTVGDYTSYQDITYQDLTDDKIELQVDKQKYFCGAILATVAQLVSQRTSNQGIPGSILKGSNFFFKVNLLYFHFNSIFHVL